MSSGQAVWRASRDARDGRAGGGLPMSQAQRRQRPEAVVSVALWVFMGVATTLFGLFILADVMRMSAEDASALVLPPQLWLSTTALVLGSLALQRAAAAARAGQMESARQWLRVGGACALAFLAVQSWAWQALLSQQVSAVGNPAGSFFYLLTAMHGLHVAGGLVAWAIVARHSVRDEVAPGDAAWRIALCARYWHFLLAVWLALFASLSWITPEVARIICRTA
jgi:cytochrome c oxidase subunit 3